MGLGAGAFLGQKSVPGDAVDEPTWRTLVKRSVMPFGFEMPEPGGFVGRIRSTDLLDVNLFSMSCGPHAAERTRQHVREQMTVDCVVSFQLAGTLHLNQFGRQATVEAGQFAAYTSDAPVRIEGSGGYRSLGVKIPLPRFRSSAEELHQFTGTPFASDRGLAAAVFSLLERLEASGGSLGPSTGASISHHAVGLVEQMLHEQAPHERLANRTVPDRSTDDLRDQCLTYIETHLQDPELSPRRIADAAFISTRYLHEVFSRTDTAVFQYVRRRRLEHIREELADPLRAGEPIERIARRWGVRNVSHFGQVFKKSVGCTPAEFRRQALG